MSPLADYTVTKRLLSGRASELHEATVPGRTDPVWVKQYRAEGAAPRVERAMREAETLRAIAGAGVPMVIDVIDTGGDAALVLEPAPGESLLARIARATLTPDELSRIGAALANVLARLQAVRIVHLALSPEIIWIDAGETGAQIVDFGFARSLGELDRDAPIRCCRGEALLYQSPEQTGRMGVGFDSRSDLYGLGACLYHAATGEPPFPLKDPLALIHAHIARKPRRAVELRPDLPATLSRILSKLLHKAPEARYQTAAALERDFLECLSQLTQHGGIDDDLILATADAPYRPLFSKKVYGRDREADVLERACMRACGGDGNVILLAGAPGIGKSALVSALRKPLATAGGYLGQGKFDLYRRDVPYSGVGEALGSIVNQLLTEDDTRLDGWRLALEAALGPIAGALLDVVPDLGLLLPGVAKVDALPPRQTLARLSLAFERLLGALATAEHPLVLFLDDLQWADGGSRELLSDLFARPSLPYILFVGAYRDNEVGGDHPFAKLAQAIEASPIPAQTVSLRVLDDAACAAMLADALGRKAGEVRSLAAIIAQKTARNPLLIQQYVAHLYDLGLLQFEAGTGWVFDEDEIASSAIAEGAEDLLAARIDPLAQVVQRTLELAACVGDEFDVDTLCALTDQPRPEIEDALFSLCDEGLIAPSRKGFRFVHDRVREAAQARMAVERRAELHYHAARLLLADLSPGELSTRAFEIADHLNLGSACVPPNERPRLVEVNRLAGDRALRAGAAAIAHRYFATALEHLSREDPKSAPAAPCADLVLQAAEAALQIPDSVAAKRWLDELRGVDLPTLLDARAESVRLQLIVMGDAEATRDAAGVVVRSLRRFGVRWPRRSTPLRTRLLIWYTDSKLRGPLDEQTFRPASGDPSGWLGPVLILGSAAPILQVETGRAVCEIAAFVLRRFLRHGYVRSPALSLASYAAFRRVALDHPGGMERLANAAMAWADRVPDPAWAPRTGYIVHGYVYAWTRSRREAIVGLSDTIARMIEAGDKQYLWFAGNVRVCYQALCGERLDRVEAELRSLFELTAREGFAWYADLCRVLIDDVPDRERLDDATDHFIEEFATVPATRMGPWVFWLTVLCILGRYDLARRIVDASSGWVFEVGAASAHLADYVLFQGITAAVFATDRRTGLRGAPRVERRVLRDSLRRMRNWAKHGRDFRHMARLLEAESERVRGNVAAALDAYRSAADLAREAAHVHHLGFILERAAQLLVATHQHEAAAVHLDRAAGAFEEWGAHAKARQLRGDAT